MEQTFQYLWIEKRQTKKELFGFVLWTFIETAIGIFRERLWLITEGNSMPTILKTLTPSALISFLLVLPFLIMEVVNRQSFRAAGKEDFPIPLFIFMWLSLVAICLILLSIVRGRRTGNHDMANPDSTQGNTLLTNPKSAVMISVVLVLPLAIISLLDSLGWGPLQSLLNGSNPDQVYVPGQLIALGLFSLSVAAAIIARGPVVSSLRAGGSLFAHPINLIIAVVIVSLFTAGVVGAIVDQMPCFLGVPLCD